MSLINDALKRASQVQKEKPATPPTSSPMTPVDPLPRSRGSSSNPVIPVVIVLIVLLGAWSLWQFKRDSKESHQAKNNVNPPGGELKPSPAQPPVSVASRAPISTSGQQTGSRVQISTNLVARGNAPTSGVARTEARPVEIAAVPVVTTPAPAPPVTTASTAAPTPAGGFPALKLQAIVYRLNNPSAMINGKTVGVGDYLDDVKIVKIDRTRVTVELNGQSRILAMP